MIGKERRILDGNENFVRLQPATHSSAGMDQFSSIQSCRTTYLAITRLHVFRYFSFTAYYFIVFHQYHFAYILTLSPGLLEEAYSPNQKFET